MHISKDLINCSYYFYYQFSMNISDKNIPNMGEFAQNRMRAPLLDTASGLACKTSMEGRIWTECGEREWLGVDRLLPKPDLQASFF